MNDKQTSVRNGLTSVHEAKVTPLMVQAFHELVREGRMPLRVYAMLDGADKNFVDEWLKRGPEVDPHHQFTIRSFKFFADGPLGSRGAALLEPYSDAPQTKGVMTTPEANVYSLTRRAMQAGFQVCTHAIGDAANRSVLNRHEKTEKEVPGAHDPRLRIEHAQVLAPEDIPRFAKLGVIASMQPTHATSDMPWAENRVGPERIKGAYAWRSVKDSGAHLPLSSDFSGETLNLYYGIYAAITRQDPQGNPPGGWHPEQRLTLEEVLRGYTLEAAYAEFEEKDKGSIEKGKLERLNRYRERHHENTAAVRFSRFGSSKRWSAEKSSSTQPGPLMPHRKLRRGHVVPGGRSHSRPPTYVIPRSVTTRNLILPSFFTKVGC